MVSGRIGRNIMTCLTRRSVQRDGGLTSKRGRDGRAPRKFGAIAGKVREVPVVGRLRLKVLQAEAK